MIRYLAAIGLLVSMWLPAFGSEPIICDGECDSICSEVCSDRLAKLPSMFGDGFFLRSGPIMGSQTLDRMMVIANDLDAPTPLPAGTLSITEPGPVGVFDTSLGSIPEIQQLLRAGHPIPSATLIGQVTDNASLTTIDTVHPVDLIDF